MITDSDLKKLKSALAPEFKKIGDKVDDISSKVNDLSTRVDGLSTKLNLLTTRVDSVSIKVDEVKTRLDILEDNVTGDIAKLYDENLITSTYRASIEDHEQRIINLESK